MRDPVVLGATLAGVLATAWALFGGRYLPGIDYSNHLGLISILANGGESGALDYMERSFAPSYYLLFYLITAGVAQFTTVDVASKLVLIAAAGGLVLATASLADACGRSPRAAAIAPLAMFGVSFGYGFVTFIFTAPFFIWSLAAAERFMTAPRTAMRKPALIYAVALCLTYLGHGMVFVATAVALVVRVFVLGLWDLAQHRGAAMPRVAETVTRLAMGAVPVLAMAGPAAVSLALKPAVEAGAQVSPSIFGWEPWSSHWAQIGGHLLERGSITHWHVMYGVLGLFALLVVAAIFLPRVEDTSTPDSRRAIVIYAAVTLALFLVGPMSIEPAQIWFVYPRFGVLAGVLLWLVPRAPLKGAFGALVVAMSVGLVAWNANINRGHIQNFTGWATHYDPVRESVPPKMRVLALTVVPGGDFSQIHPALGSLYFYHLVDGASYTAFLFDHRALPVRSRLDVKKPNAPFWRNPDSYDPAVHGIEFDYLVLRGPGLAARTDAAGLHELVVDHEGWRVYRTKNPTPRPSR